MELRIAGDGVGDGAYLNFRFPSPSRLKGPGCQAQAFAFLASSQVILMRDDAVTQSLVHSQAASGACWKCRFWGPIPNLIQTLWGRDPAAWLLTAQQMVVLQTEVEKHQWSQRGPQLVVIRCTATGRWAQCGGKGGVGAAVAPKEAGPETGSSPDPAF